MTQTGILSVFLQPLAYSLRPDKHWWSSGDDTALVRRKRGFDSHPVLWMRLLFDNLVKPRTHDVAVAYRLAMAEVRVQLPLGASGQAEGLRLEAGGFGEDDRRDCD